MKILKRTILFFDLIIILCMITLTCLFYLTPDVYVLNTSSSYLKLNEKTVSASNGNVKEAELSLCGIMPIKDVKKIENKNEVVICGTPMGIDIYTKGLTVAGTNAVDSSKSPAYKAGMRVGDKILLVNGNKIETISQLRDNITSSNLKIEIERNEKILVLSVKPIFSKQNSRYEIGLWVRDSSLGMGMVSFYSKELNMCACLGHSILDVDTGKPVDLDSGSIYTSTVYAVKKASEGNVGQLYGKINIYEKIGNIVDNSEKGLYCKMIAEPIGEKYQVAEPDEIEKGSAQIITTVDGVTQKYSLEILSVNSNNDTKNLKVKITDKALLSLTGGIVQGMSGSPIIQKGKLIGVLNFAIVDNPTEGYAIFAKTMYDKAHIIKYNKG